MTDPHSVTQDRQPEPGWYEDDYGFVRWWNGAVWDVGAPGSAGGPGPGPMGPGPGPMGPGPMGPGPMGPGPVPPFGGPMSYGAPAYAAPPGYPGAGGYPGYPPPGRSDGRTMAMLAHFGAFFGGFILPLVILLTAGKDDPFVRHHAAEALNFQLAYLMFAFGGILISIVTLGFGLIIFFPLLMVVAVLHIVWAIMGAIAANRGEWWRYPVNIRMVKGAV